MVKMSALHAVVHEFVPGSRAFLVLFNYYFFKLKYLQKFCHFKTFELFYYVLAYFLVQIGLNEAIFHNFLLSKFASYGIRTRELGITA